jgi:hypothetical protein
MSVQLDVHNVVINEINYVSSMIASFTFPELVLKKDTKLLEVVICAMIRLFDN